MRIFLLGFMGCGKTTLGKQLASYYKFDFIDLDKLFEQRHETTIHDFFNNHSELAFRKIESELLREIAEKENVVVSLGGGTPCFYDNMDWLLAHGICVYVSLPPKSLFDRLTNSKTKRPLLQGKTSEELLLYIEEEIGKREVFYKKAPIHMDGMGKSRLSTLVSSIECYKLNE